MYTLWSFGNTENWNVNSHKFCGTPGDGQADRKSARTFSVWHDCTRLPNRIQCVVKWVSSLWYGWLRVFHVFFVVCLSIFCANGGPIHVIDCVQLILKWYIKVYYKFDLTSFFLSLSHNLYIRPLDLCLATAFVLSCVARARCVNCAVVVEPIHFYKSTSRFWNEIASSH